MTLERLEEEMSENEFELRLARELLRSEGCPQCGQEARDVFDQGLMTMHVKCPLCKHEYFRISEVREGDLRNRQEGVRPLNFKG